MGQHILVPVDGSEEAEQALEYALTQRPDPAVTLLHVVNPVSTFGYADDDYFDFDAYQGEAKRQRERGEELLEEYREAAAERGVEVETAIRTGAPAAEILAAVDELGADHIVMGSRGRSGVGRVLFGSVAEAVTRRASVPVTIVR
jgi:nucleotide-binding universal stress UspA family protein